jgi:hypothetical protein
MSRSGAAHVASVVRCRPQLGDRSGGRRVAWSVAFPRPALGLIYLGPALLLHLVSLHSAAAKQTIRRRSADRRARSAREPIASGGCRLPAFCVAPCLKLAIWPASVLAGQRHILAARDLCAPSRIRTCAHGSGRRSSGPLITPAEMHKCILRAIRLRRQSAWVPDLALCRGVCRPASATSTRRSEQHRRRRRCQEQQAAHRPQEPARDLDRSGKPRIVAQTRASALISGRTSRLAAVLSTTGGRSAVNI